MVWCRQWSRPIVVSSWNASFFGLTDAATLKRATMRGLHPLFGHVNVACHYAEASVGRWNPFPYGPPKESAQRGGTRSRGSFPSRRCVAAENFAEPLGELMLTSTA